MPFYVISHISATSSFTKHHVLTASFSLSLLHFLELSKPSQLDKITILPLYCKIKSSEYSKF